MSQRPRCLPATAVEEHLPLTLINDWNLNVTDLSRYKVLILPNAACLDARQVEAIDRFVRNGGGLVASLDTSLFDEFGTPRDDFALAGVLGVSYRGIPDSRPMPADRRSRNRRQLRQIDRSRLLGKA